MIFVNRISLAENAEGAETIINIYFFLPCKYALANVI